MPEFSRYETFVADCAFFCVAAAGSPLMQQSDMEAAQEDQSLATFCRNFISGAGMQNEFLRLLRTATKKAQKELA